MSDGVTYITAETAIAAIERCAFTSDGRRLVHCFSGGIGCDWDEHSVIETVRGAYVHEGVPQIAWVDSLFGRCLAVVEQIDDRQGGRQRLFDTVKPEEATT